MALPEWTDYVAIQPTTAKLQGHAIRLIIAVVCEFEASGTTSAEQRLIRSMSKSTWEKF
jgi:hypothetical protein